ncbi:MAG TPA: type II toxin-antitoxin system HicB family antitoxin [Candidatus Ozemobacteraceae bacterium]|nr:type II toxin-antitoxin system HicB family antitoxin [Candidatus Ozemobacteraceae bacterium]
MLFPVVVHKDKKSCFGVTIPDFPGCFTSGNTLEEAIKNVQEAIECHLDEGEAIPKASDIETLAKNPDFSGGIWVMVDVDLSAFESRAKRINITIPENLLHEIDSFVQKHGLSRSSFLSRAARTALKAA